jgi:hypothetical protein
MNESVFITQENINLNDQKNLIPEEKKKSSKKILNSGFEMEPHFLSTILSLLTMQIIE